MSSRASAVLVAALTFVVVGCSAPEPGNPTPTRSGGSDTTSTTSSKTSASPDDTNVPPVVNPVDTAKFEGDPCAAITAAQAEKLGIVYPGVEKQLQSETVCTWTNDDRGAIQVGLFGDVGLNAAYQALEDGELAFLEPIPDVAGLPAVSNGVVDRRSQGVCSVSVGMSDTVMLSLVLNQSRSNVGKKEPCTMAAEVAGMVVETLRRG